MKRLLLAALCIMLMLSLCSCELIGSLLGNGNDSEQSSQKSSESQSNVEKETDSLSNTELESQPDSESDTSDESEAQTEEITHTHTFTSEITPPACVDRGYTTHTCDCGYSYIDTFVDSVGEHTFEQGICTRCEEIDYPDLINIISTQTIKANVTVRAEYSNKSFGSLAQVVGIMNGSGAIIKKNATSYYVITNNHVVYNADLEPRTQYTNFYVIDYLGNEYRADCVANMAEYDLAIVKFTSVEQYTILSLEAGNSVEGDFVVSLGQPEGQSNTITLGNVVDYCKITLKDTDPLESNVTFDVLSHDAYINSGSSGGALLDSHLNIIGINYAGTIDQQGNNLASYAIPVEKVYEFFELVGFEYERPAENEDTESNEPQTELESENESAA